MLKNCIKNGEKKFKMLKTDFVNKYWAAICSQSCIRIQSVGENSGSDTLSLTHI
jgi:hypothetical protein